MGSGAHRPVACRQKAPRRNRDRAVSGEPFAPPDEAFKKLPLGALDALLKDTAKLKAVLSYHVVPGHVMAQDFKSGEVMTVQGTALTEVVSSSDTRVNGARVSQRDITASNGVIHDIDAVIMPKNWQLLAAAA